MRVTLAYGEGRLPVTVPDDAVVVEPRDLPGLDDERAAFRRAVRAPRGARPLREIVRADDTVAIVIADVTRPSPSERLVPWILEECAHVPKERVVIVNGTGSHRANTEDELVAMVGRDVVERYAIVNHDAFDPASLVRLGTTSRGGPAWLNRRYVDASARIVTGFIEPHFFAGFSGGAKGVAPGVAGIETIMHLHGAKMIGDPAATWGRLRGNPVQEELREVVAFAPPHFLVNVAINRARAITGLWAGHYLEAFEEGCAFVAESAMAKVDEPFDVVLTSNSGYPLDQNLYQAVKGMSAAARIVRKGGAIVAAAECRDGLPSHGRFKDILAMRASAGDLLRMIEAPGFSLFDQWEAQTLAIILQHAEVHLRSSLADDVARASHVVPSRDVDETVRALLARFGPRARVGVLPEGPQTIPYLRAARTDGA